MVITSDGIYMPMCFRFLLLFFHIARSLKFKMPINMFISFLMRFSSKVGALKGKQGGKSEK